MTASRLDRVLVLVRRHRPNLQLVVKSEVASMRLLGRVLRPVIPDFDTAFTTVIGDTVYLPYPIERWNPDALARTLLHELVHQLDQAQFGAWFYTSYALFPLPIWRTGRAFWELRGYTVDLLLAWEGGGEEALRRCVERVVPLFCGSSYVWMLGPESRARADVEAVADRVRSGEIAATEPYREMLAAWRG